MINVKIRQFGADASTAAYVGQYTYVIPLGDCIKRITTTGERDTIEILVVRGTTHRAKFVDGDDMLTLIAPE